MRAMVLERVGEPLRERELPLPEPGPRDVLIRVAACGVCRTDLHVVDGELTEPVLPLVPGHEIVGRVAAAGGDVSDFRVGDRVGVPWLGGSCGTCRYCRRGRENLCDAAVYTGYTRDGGYAEYTLADARYCLALPEAYGDVAAAPLLCAGLIGYRTYRMAGEPVERLGIYGFGAAGHLVAQLAASQGVRVYAFTRPGDDAGQAFARELGCVWAGGSDTMPPEPLDAALIFAPVGPLVPAALRAVDKGGAVVCGGIHMSDIPSFPYRLLWEERLVRSVANLTREDGHALMDAAAQATIDTRTLTYPLARANDALDDLRAGRFTGAAVLLP
ncbi:zinc-binding alcohol dehydrogenase family protein [Salinisphaera sp. PC39]|uniref:zinc-dependent alcohol dehydrogenase family protein n=1 Tax=Salinisphaera sp. PC39 TaxID=1304156 RepID=UPI003341A5A2